MVVNLLKSILHNIGVVIVGLGLAYLGARVDTLVGVSAFTSPLVQAAAWLLLALGFLVRVWATVYFYAHNMRVIALEPQTDAHHVRPVSFFAESALSRRKRVHVLRSGVALRIANGALRYRYAPSADGSLYPPGRTTVRARFR